MSQRQRHPKRPIEKAYNMPNQKVGGSKRPAKAVMRGDVHFVQVRIAGLAKCQSGLRHEMTKIMPTKSGGAWILVHTVGSNHEIL